MTAFFGDEGLRDVGPIVWRFLDDQPWALRVAFGDGCIRDLPLYGKREPPPWEQVTGEVLGFFSGKAVITAGHMLVLDELRAAAPGQKPKAGLQPSGASREWMVGHQGDVTCFSAASDGGEDDLIATGSTDMTVRIWRGGQCLKAFAAQEWSEWTGTMYIGHVTTVTAVLVTAEGRVASGDRFGAVCIWREDETCQMLDLPVMGAVTCLAAGPTDGLLIGHSDGDVRAATWDAQLLAVWTGAGAGLLAAAVEPGSGRVLAASEAGFSQALSGKVRKFSQMAFFPEPARAARFEGGVLIVCGPSAVTLWALDGRPLATLPAPDVRVATVLYTREAKSAAPLEDRSSCRGGGLGPPAAGPRVHEPP